MRCRSILAVVTAALAGTLAHAQEPDSSTTNTRTIAESAVALYRDPVKTSTEGSVMATTRSSLFHREGFESSMTFGYTHKRHHFTDTAGLYNITHEPEAFINEQFYTVAVDQGLGIGRIAGLTLGMSRSAMGRGRWYVGRLSEWWLQETLQTTLDFRHTTTEQPSIDSQDIDGRRVTTPERVEGRNVALGLTHMTTPTTIIRGRFSHTTRDDRPPAWSVNGEIRQFITYTNSAAHAAYTRYNNTGTIERVTFTGEIQTNTVKVEWHQRFAGSAIAMGGYRWSVQQETPRAKGFPVETVGSDTLYGSLRWRFNDDVWTDDSPEIYAFGARYLNNQTDQAFVSGLGAKILW